MAFKVTPSFRRSIERMLNDRATRDQAFAAKFAEAIDGGKSITECCEYIASEVFRRKITAITAQEVEGIAVHYFDEDDIRTRTFAPAPGGSVVITADEAEVASLSAEEVEEAKKEAKERFIRAEMEKMTSTTRKPAKTPKNSEKLPFVEQTLF